MDVEPPDTRRGVSARVLAVLLLAGAAIASPAAFPNGQSRPEPSSPSPATTDAANEEQFVRVAEGTIEKVCIQCHPWDNIVRTRKTIREWQDTMTAMEGRGANASDEQFKMIVQYLTRYYGLVAVNTATAEELAAVLGFSPKDAAAIVEYRKAHGKFADAAALVKVPGIDKTKIEEQPEALRFN